MATETVLIIDDSIEIRSLLESILPYEGYRTLSASTGWEGLGLALSAQPDALLVDLELPDIGGLKILEQLNREKVTIPAIMMTGYGSEGVAARALRLGAVGYLIKPFTTEEVLLAVEKALGVGRLRRDKAHSTALVQAYARHLRTISALSRAIVQGLEPDSCLQRIVEAAMFMTRAERCTLSLLNDIAGQFHIVARQGKSACDLQDFPATAGDARLQPVLQGLVVRLQAAPGSAIELQTGDWAQAVLQVPLVGQNGVAGLLSVDRQEKESPFGEHDEQALSILADYAILVLAKEHRGEMVADYLR